MADGDGLASLKMGVAGDGILGVLFSLAKERLLKSYGKSSNFVNGLARIESRIGSDLIIARAGGVELGSSGPNVGGEGGLDIEMDVFQLGGELELTFLDAFLNGEEAGFDFREFVLG